MKREIIYLNIKVKINKTEESSLLNHKPFKASNLKPTSEVDNVFEENLESNSTSLGNNDNNNHSSSSIENSSKTNLIENSEQYQQQLEENKSLRADLNEKNKVRISFCASSEN